MEEILWRKYSRHFNAEDYPTTDMLAEGEVAPTGTPAPKTEVEAETAQ